MTGFLIGVLVIYLRLLTVVPERSLLVLSAGLLIIEYLFWLLVSFFLGCVRYIVVRLVRDAESSRLLTDGSTVTRFISTPLLVLVVVLDRGGLTFTVRLTRVWVRRKLNVDSDDRERLELAARFNDVDRLLFKPDVRVGLADPLALRDDRFNDVDLLLFNPEFAADLDIPLKLLMPELFVDLTEVPREDERLIDRLDPPEDDALADIFVPLEAEPRFDREDNDDELERFEAFSDFAFLDAPIQTDAASKTNTIEMHCIVRICLFVPAVLIIRLLFPAIVQIS